LFSWFCSKTLSKTATKFVLMQRQASKGKRVVCMHSLSPPPPSILTHFLYFHTDKLKENQKPSFQDTKEARTKGTQQETKRITWSMENGAVNGYEMETPKNITIKGIRSSLMGDPTAHSCFHTCSRSCCWCSSIW